MTEKIYEFNELDPKFWKLWTGSGHFNFYDVSEGKFKFKSAYVRVAGLVYVPAALLGYITLRTSRPYSFINNVFSVDVGVTKDSYGEIYMSFSYYEAEGGDIPYAIPDSDSVAIFKKDDVVLGEAMKIRRGAVSFLQTKEFEKEKLSATLKAENSQGMMNIYVDETLIASFPQEFKYGYIYICVRPFYDEEYKCRKLEGWIDNFKIKDYETACVNPELATLIPNLTAMSSATLSLVGLLSIIGILKGLMAK